MNLDTRPLLAHVVNHAPNHCSCVINRERWASVNLPEIVQVVRPLLTVFELKGKDGIVAVLSFCLRSNAQPLCTLVKDFLEFCGFSVLRWYNWHVRASIRDAQI